MQAERTNIKIPCVVPMVAIQVHRDIQVDNVSILSSSRYQYYVCIHTIQSSRHLMQ